MPSLKALFLGALAGGLLIAGFGPASAIASPTTMVDLGKASSYAALSGASVGNTVSAPGAPYTILRGDLGVKANSDPTGFPPGVVTGTIEVGNVAAEQAHADLVAAYTEVAARPGGSPLAGALAGMTISPGLHTVAGAASNTTTLTLDGGGDPNAVFVFQIDGALAFAAGSHVVLTNGAQASRVFWQVNGAGAVGASADFAGTLMAMDAVDVGNGSLVNGRAFARNGALTLDNNQFYSHPPVVTITGGENEYTTDTTPTISGTTDLEAPGIVTVTISGQTLTATPIDGEWSVTSAILANDTYPVVASVRDAAGNPGSATQQLTVDTVPPVVTLDGGASVTTNDPTPTISGTSDVAVDTRVRVTVDSQTLHALVQTGGTWNIRADALADGTYTVTASVSDPAGNVGTARQTLTKDTTTPPEPDPEATPPEADPEPTPPATDPETTPPEADPGTEITDAELKAKKVQRQRKRVKAVARASAGEPVDLITRGRVKIRGQRKAIKLRPVRRSTEADQSVRLVLKPAKRKHHRKILRALRAGKKAQARVRVLFSDTAGNKHVLKAAIRLRRARANS